MVVHHHINRLNRYMSSMAQLSSPSLNPKTLAVVRERAWADVENKNTHFSVPIIGPMLTRFSAFINEAHNKTTSKEGHSEDNANPDKPRLDQSQRDLTRESGDSESFWRAMEWRRELDRVGWLCGTYGIVRCSDGGLDDSRHARLDLPSLTWTAKTRLDAQSKTNRQASDKVSFSPVDHHAISARLPGKLDGTTAVHVDLPRVLSLDHAISP
jgi:hypothetical protein